MERTKRLLQDVLVCILNILGAAVLIVLFAALIAAPFVAITFGVLIPLHFFGVV